MTTSEQKLKGIIVPMVTPLTSDGRIDEAGTARLVEHMIKGGVHGIFVLGSTGEAHCLPARARHDFVRLVGRLVAGRVPLLAGVTDTSLEDSLSLAQTAAESGACRIVAAAPYYYHHTQDDLVRWYTSLADAAPLPLFLYNMPSCVKVSLAPATVDRLASHENIVGLKDSSANMTYFQTLLHVARKHEGFSVFVGPEELTGECVLMGAAGGVNGGGNLFPGLLVSMYEAAAAHNVDKVRELQKDVMHISTTLYSIGDGPLGYLKGLKAALEMRGICSGHMAHPFADLSVADLDKVREILSGLDESGRQS